MQLVKAFVFEAVMWTLFCLFVIHLLEFWAS